MVLIAAVLKMHLCLTVFALRLINILFLSMTHLYDAGLIGGHSTLYSFLDRSEYVFFAPQYVF